MQAKPFCEKILSFQPEELLATLSTEGILTSISSFTSQLTGWSPDEYVGKPVQSFLHSDDAARVRDRYSELLTGNAVTLRGLRGPAKDGGFLAWNLSFVPRIEAGALVEILVLGKPAEEPPNVKGPALKSLKGIPIYTDETEPSSMANAEYLGLAKLLEGMLGNAPFGLALFDEKLRFICLNQTFSEMSGYSPAQHLGKHLRDLFPKSVSLVEPKMGEVLSTGISAIGHEVEVETSTVPLIAQVSLYPVPDMHGGICGVAMIAMDITERKHAEAILRKTAEDLVRSNLALEEFSYIASHDLREPLRTISNFVSLLKRKYEGKLDEEAQGYIRFVADGSQRMGRLIEKILEYSLSGKAAVHFAKVDCSKILQRSLSNLNSALVECQGSVTCDPLPTVWGEESLLLQLFQNLVANALKYRGSDPPKIHIAAKRELGTCVFSVSDNGIGIHPDQFLNIFKPYRKLHSQSEYAGSGLGLAICQKNVELHGGSIWVTSQEGKGTTFYFTIPELGPEKDPVHESLK